MMGQFEHVADRADPAIHHVGRGNDVGTGIGLVQRLLGQYVERPVIFDIAVLVDQPVLAMAGIGIERDVGQNADIIAQRVLHRLCGATHQVVGVQRFPAIIAALAGRGIGKQGNAGNAEIKSLAGALDDAVDRPARDARKRRDRFLDALPFGNEQRPDQIRC